jgi:hypothetical protein
MVLRDMLLFPLEQACRQDPGFRCICVNAQLGLLVKGNSFFLH